MTTTTGDPSTLKTPSSLSGGDLVSRLLAATPPYLYNVPLTPHSFFFSEMLRSFVQAKTDANTSLSSVSSSNIGRRRKRSWKETRDRPLELTTKDKSLQHHVAVHNSQEKYFISDLSENRYKNHNEATIEDTKNVLSNFNEKIVGFGSEVLKPIDENRPDFIKHSQNFFDDTSRSLAGDAISQQDIERKNYEERLKNVSDVSNFIADTKNKMDFSARNILSTAQPTKLDDVPKNFGIPNGLPTNPEFIPNPLWYPPYPIHQSYPGIDPLHFFIDLRVSGHIWDRKINDRQLPFKSKHCSAFSVPQSKEFNNRPLNLTRDEAGNSKRNDENSRGTHFILKNLTKTYRDIEKNLKTDRNDDNTSMENKQEKKNDEDDKESCSGDGNSRDLRALIGLELVVDYVKEPKEEPISQQSPETIE